MLDNALDLLIVVLGFGALIFIHELGHFLAARWAGIRVLTFAIGIGSTIVSYRPGLGFRRGSSEREYLDRVARAGDEPALDENGRPLKISPTEYTLKWIPLGGFVRMLGQEDMRPDRVSAADDSYQSCPVWKRMVVISAGVIANIVTAAIVFVGVFLVGLPSTPATVGPVGHNSPAAAAVLARAPQGIDPGAIGPGLRPGDRVLSLDAEPPLEFTELATAIAMAPPSRPLTVEVERDGYDAPIVFELSPQKSPFSGLLTAGFEQPRSLTVAGDDGIDIGAILERDGYTGVGPGATLAAVRPDGDAGFTDLAHYGDLAEAIGASGGAPMTLRFTLPDGATTDARVTPQLEPRVHDRDADPGVFDRVRHVLGLHPCMAVNSVTEDSPNLGVLRAGDVFVRFGQLEFPDESGILDAIQSSAGRVVDAVVLRRSEDGVWRRVPVELTIVRDGGVGRAGFMITPFMSRPAVLAQPALGLYDNTGAPAPADGLGERLGRFGVRVIDVDGIQTETFGDLAIALRARALAWLATDPAEGQTLELAVTLEMPIRDADGDAPDPVGVPWALSRDEAERLAAMGWTLPGSLLDLLEPESFVLRADGPIEALGMGLHRTKSAMTRVYLTLLRITQGSVQVRHLNGPVGIAHTGTILADRGLVWLLFFFGLISVNLAVVNFLPIPILDGGQFLFLVYEQFRGKPPPIPVQNALTLAGLVLIGAMFLVVTYNDVRNLLGI